MKPWKKLLIGLLLLVGLALLSGAGLATYEVIAFDQSMAKVYAVPLPTSQLSTDAAVLERGKHLAESLGACLDCHGDDLGGKLMADMGPIGVVHTPNITSGGVLARYSDAELLRLLREGIKRDGTSLLFMPAGDFRWWPEADLVAVASFVRARPAVTRASTPSTIGAVGKVLDRVDMIPIDIARRIDHTKPPAIAPEPAATVAYGRFLGQLCQGCHGPTLSGGPIPGAPPDMAVPANITPHATGLAKYDEATFYEVITTGVRPDGRTLDPMMPIATLAAMNAVEKKALWLYLRSVPPKPFGGR